MSSRVNGMGTTYLAGSSTCRRSLVPTCRCVANPMLQKYVCTSRFLSSPRVDQGVAAVRDHEREREAPGEVTARAPSPVTESSCRNKGLLTIRCAWPKVGDVSYRQSPDQEPVCDRSPSRYSSRPSPSWVAPRRRSGRRTPCRSEEHTSELQSLTNLVCR